MITFKTVLTVGFRFPNHNGPGNLSFGVQKTLNMDLNITPNMNYRLRLFNEGSMLGQITNVEILDRGTLLIKDVTIEIYHINSIEDLFGCSFEKFEQELLSLGFSKFKAL